MGASRSGIIRRLRSFSPVRSDETQLADNIRIAADALPCALSVAEIQVFATVKEELLRKTKNPLYRLRLLYAMPFRRQHSGLFFRI